ncbi:hypothetical protein AAKU55_001768 [Oxalobacteraceae bacterium GrIS 1.11]
MTPSSTIFHASRTLRPLVLAMVALALAAPATPALASPLDWLTGGQVSGSGQLQKQRRPLEHFDAVALNFPANVELRLGDNESVSIETDANILPMLETVVENGTLKIRSSKRNLHPTKLKIVVQAKKVTSLSVGGSGSLQADALHGGTLRFDVGGSGTIDVGQLDGKDVVVAIGGSGNFKAGGVAEHFSVSIGGSGNVDASRLGAAEVQVSIGGSGKAMVWARQSLQASIAGSGDVHYYGDPQVSRSVQGSGQVKRLGAAPQ